MEKGSDIMKDLPNRSRSFWCAKRKIALGIAASLLASVSIAAGTAIVPSNFEVPVLLANGEIITPPWYVTVEGEPVALVNSKEDAADVVEQVADHYKNDETIKIEIEEQTDAAKMDLENGDRKPQILTVEEAAEKITSKQELTVKTTEVITEREPVKFKKVTEKTDQLCLGQEKLKQEGKKGLKEVTRKIMKENGMPVEKTVLEESILEEPQKQIVLAGTREEQQTEMVSRGGQRGTGQLARPVSNLRITSSFGPRWGRTHLGVDFGMPLGSSIFAADGGSVIFAGYSGSYGNFVKVDHGNGFVTCYAHCSKITVQTGQAVDKGAVIAQVGSTGNSTGPHLHFEVRVNGRNMNPMNYL